ncbi:MAG: threonine synthase [Gammaproteobacteria bacterium]|nr:MAG: threonine synthase [Gammaproteobacteria bacterium]
MNFASTRNLDHCIGLSQALALGLAPDGGLFVPSTLPSFQPSDFNADHTLAAVACRLLRPFFADDALSGQLDAICDEALDIPAPLTALKPEHTWMLELFHGPTAAFKDFGARFLAACLQRLHPPDQAPLTILVATSGDTGAAVAQAFHRKRNLRVVVLYPDGRVSPRQAHQLGCFGDNILTLRVAGNFDDCQRLAKQAFGDPHLHSRLSLSSANSISLGRLLPQMSYYAYASISHWRSRGGKLNFVIPTGNLGNALAAILARRCGLPIGDIALATNANRVLPDYFSGSAYQPTASLATLANAMDVGAPSNFERLRWLYPDEQALRGGFIAEAVEDASIREVIANGEARYGRMFCPHTACAVRVLERIRDRGDSRHWAVVATAHPAKFEQVVEPLVGHSVEVPAALAALLDRPSKAEPIGADFEPFRERLRKL